MIRGYTIPCCKKNILNLDFVYMKVHISCILLHYLWSCIESFIDLFVRFWFYDTLHWRLRNTRTWMFDLYTKTDENFMDQVLTWKGENVKLVREHWVQVVSLGKFKVLKNKYKRRTTTKFCLMSWSISGFSVNLLLILAYSAACMSFSVQTQAWDYSSITRAIVCSSRRFYAPEHFVVGFSAPPPSSCRKKKHVCRCFCRCFWTMITSTKYHIQDLYPANESLTNTNYTNDVWPWPLFL